MSTLLDSYSESNTAGYDRVSAADAAIGQAFKTPNDGVNYKISSAKFYIKKVGSASGNLRARLYSGTGTYGTDFKPPTNDLTTNLLGASDAISAASISTTESLVEFTFSGAQQYQMAPNTAYCIILECDGGDSSNYIATAYDNTSPSHGGNRTYFNIGSIWFAQSTLDNIFYVYGNLPSNIKTINGLVKGSVKTINGLVIASVKTWNGLARVIKNLVDKLKIWSPNFLSYS